MKNSYTRRGAFSLTRLLMSDLFFITTKLTCRYEAQRNSGRVQLFVYARHGRELMG